MSVSMWLLDGERAVVILRLVTLGMGFGALVVLGLALL